MQQSACDLPAVLVESRATNQTEHVHTPMQHPQLCTQLCLSNPFFVHRLLSTITFRAEMKGHYLIQWTNRLQKGQTFDVTPHQHGAGLGTGCNASQLVSVTHIRTQALPERAAVPTGQCSCQEQSAATHESAKHVSTQLPQRLPALTLHCSGSGLSAKYLLRQKLGHRSCPGLGGRSTNCIYQDTFRLQVKCIWSLTGPGTLK